jgi:hypothetical protein
MKTYINTLKGDSLLGHLGSEGVITSTVEVTATTIIAYETSDIETLDAAGFLDISLKYKQQRAVAYPSLQDQADMAYWDRKNGTTTLDDALDAIKAEFPKPE